MTAQRAREFLSILMRQPAHDKLELAEKAGIAADFALYREVRALLPDILLPDGEY